MPPTPPEQTSDISVDTIGEVVVTTIIRPGRSDLKIYMERKQAARYVLDLQLALKGLVELPDHPGFPDAS